MGRDAEERGEKRRERRETMTQPQQHCDHECVCPDYKASHSENGEDECYGDPDPCSLSCYHRSHPYQSERDKVLTEKRIDYLRSLGWMVAVHNDYKQNGEFHTFWLLTYSDGEYLKCEGKTDEEAYEQNVEELRQAGEP